MPIDRSIDTGFAHPTSRASSQAARFGVVGYRSGSQNRARYGVTSVGYFILRGSDFDFNQGIDNPLAHFQAYLHHLQEVVGGRLNSNGAVPLQAPAVRDNEQERAGGGAGGPEVRA